MLKRRLISAFVIISAMVLLLWVDFWLGTEGTLGRPGLVLCLLALVTSAMAASELMFMWKVDGESSSSSLVIFCTLIMVGVSCTPVLWDAYPADCPLGKFGWSLSGIIIAIVIVFAWEMYRFGRAPATELGDAGLASKPPMSDESNSPANLDAARLAVTNRIARSALAFVYLNMLFGFLVPHRLLSAKSSAIAGVVGEGSLGAAASTIDSNSLGLIAIVALIATVKLSDSFAYFIGKSCGTVRIAPRLSPKKTLQGSFGALLGGCVAAAIVVFIVAPMIFGVTIDKPWWWFLLYGILVTCAGMMGDLAESLFKRDADCKDSSSWLPGLGGVLDVLDSMIFAAPVSFILWMM